MQTLFHKKTFLNGITFPHKTFFANRAKAKRKLKRMYQRSISNIKEHPYRSLGLFAFFFGILSALILFFQKKK